jgi:hypothetical protein
MHQAKYFQPFMLFPGKSIIKIELDTSLPK